MKFKAWRSREVFSSKSLAALAVIGVIAYFGWIRYFPTSPDSAKASAQASGGIASVSSSAGPANEPVKNSIGSAIDDATAIFAVQSGEPAPQDGKSASSERSLTGSVLGLLKEGAKLGAAATDSVLGLSIDEEWRYGGKVREVLGRELKLSNDLAANERLKKLAKPILDQCSRTRGRNFYFGVIDSDERRAFSTMGGNIFISKGFLNALASDHATQSVLAHEIGHIELGHCVRASTIQARAAEIAGDGAGAAASLLDRCVRVGYSQDEEYAADEFAFSKQRELGISKAGRLEALQILESLERSETPTPTKTSESAMSKVIDRLNDHYRSHPPTAERISRLQRLEP